MCAVSATIQYFQDRHNSLLPLPGALGYPQPQWTPESVGLLKQILSKLERLDTMLGEPDCIDPAKAAFVADLEKRVAKLEEQKGE
jgi:hypothetical protein